MPTMAVLRAETDEALRQFLVRASAFLNKVGPAIARLVEDVDDTTDEGVKAAKNLVTNVGTLVVETTGAVKELKETLAVVKEVAKEKKLEVTLPASPAVEKKVKVDFGSQD
jgi:hypothetical protein